VKKIRKVSDLVPQQRNANKGTPRGSALLETSLRRYGAGRSVLADKHGRLIAGNHVTEASVDAGINDVIVVQSDGKKLVVVQRTDLDLERDPEAKALAIADNRVPELNIAWDPDVLAALEKEDVPIGDFFRPQEYERIVESDTAQIDEGAEIPEMELEPFEEYDYVMLVFRSSQDFSQICDLLGIGKSVWANKEGVRKIGVGRVIDGHRVLEMLNETASRHPVPKKK
jgi:hypothetical protein